MESSTSPKVTRPLVRRSYTAHPDLSPRTYTNALQASQPPSKKHHLDFLHHHSHKRQDEKSHTVPSTGHLRPVAAVEKAAAKATATRSGGSSRDETQPESKLEDANNNVLKRRKMVRPVDVVREKALSKQRDDELRTSLNELSELAHNSTRRLDNTYYSILEKVVTLRSTIGSLLELSTASRKLHDDFNTEVGELEHNIQGQVDLYGGFEGQQSRVEDLESRVKSGQERTSILSERLEAARKRVELWEKREHEWQTKTSKRLRMGWVMLGAFLALIALVVVLRRPEAFSAQSSIDMDSIRSLLENASMPAFAVDDLAQVISSRLIGPSDASKSSPAASPSDTRLTMFDEL